MELRFVGFVALLHLLAKLVLLGKASNAVQKLADLAFESLNFVLGPLIRIAYLVVIIALGYVFHAQVMNVFLQGETTLTASLRLVA